MRSRFVQTPVFRPDQLGMPDLALALLEITASYNVRRRSALL